MTVSRLILIAVSFSVMSIVAIIGNFHLLYTIATVRALQTVGNSFLFSLAVADFLVGLVVMPTTVVTSIANKWLAGDIMCSVSAFLDNVTLTMSMWSLGLLSIERYFLMVYPLRYHNYMTPTVAKILIACSWIFVIVLSALPLVGWGQYDVTETFSCGIKPQPPFPAYFLTFCILAFFPPLIIGILCYVRIIYALRKKYLLKKTLYNVEKKEGSFEGGSKFGIRKASSQISSQISSTLSGGQTNAAANRETSRHRQSKADRKMNLMAALSVFICLLLMICFNFPTVIFALSAISGTVVETSDTLGLLLHILWYAKSTGNPITFGALNITFRTAFVDNVAKLCCPEARLNRRLALRMRSAEEYSQSQYRVGYRNGSEKDY